MEKVTLDPEQLQDIFFRVHLEVQDRVRLEVEDQVRKEVTDRIVLLERRLCYLEAESRNHNQQESRNSNSTDGSLRNLLDKPSDNRPLAGMFQRFLRDERGAAQHVGSAASYTAMKTLATAAPTVELEEQDLTSPTNAGQKPPKLPESMYNYCMQCISLSSQPMREPAVFWLVLLIAVQFFTMTSFCVSNDILNNALGAVPEAQRPHIVTNCVFSTSSLFGVPIVQYCIGCVAIFLVAGIIRSDDKDTLVAAFPPRDHHTIVRSITKVAWFWTVVYMPACFSLEAATMFANSADALTVVMNTLQVTFIVDIDNMMYRNFLSVEHKMAYQQSTRIPEISPSAAEGCSWKVFYLNVVLMLIIFIFVLVTIGKGELYGDVYLETYYWTIGPLYFTSFSGRYLVRKFYSSSQTNLLLSMGAGMMGMSLYVIAFSFSMFRFKLPSASELSACHHAGGKVATEMQGV